jgi:hypothetical protein
MIDNMALNYILCSLYLRASGIRVDRMFMYYIKNDMKDFKNNVTVTLEDIENRNKEIIVNASFF